MAYITKAVLEEQVNLLRARVSHLELQLKMQNEQLAFFKSYTPGGFTSAMAIALEKVTEATAHVISDLKTFRR